MKFRLIEHAKERASERGTTEEEIEAVLLGGVEVEAKKGRKAKEKVFEYGSKWLGNPYPQKKIKAIYVEEGDEIVVITVKVFYGEWR